MNNNEIEQLIGFTGESFYEHVEEPYGKLVGKILRYHDIDNYTILSKVGEHELIDLFEKPDDEHSTNELINLKKEICNISYDTISLKIGTKNKLILLLKSTQAIIKKQKLQLQSQARLKRLNKYQSTSSSANNSASDGEISLGKYHSTIKESISHLLTKMNSHIHGITHTNISTNNFKVIIENINDFDTPTCSIGCICGDRVKLYFKNRRFQLTNLAKHLKTVNNKSSFLIDNENQAVNDSEDLNQMDLDDDLMRSVNNRSIDQNNSSKYSQIDHYNHGEATPVTIKKKVSSVVFHYTLRYFIYE